MSYTMADFRRDDLKEHLQSVTAEERQKALQSLTAEERLKGLSSEVIANYLKKLQSERPSRKGKPRRKS